MRNGTEVLFIFVLLVILVVAGIYIADHTTWFNVFGVKGVVVR